jgi:formamidopyrimidine-DNA glycosylase
MPELPEVEVLARHLGPLLRGRRIRDVNVRRSKVVGAIPPVAMRRSLRGASFAGVSRRGKYLLFKLRAAGRREAVTLVGHLGMTGRMYLLPAGVPLPKHAVVVLDLGRERFVFEDTRYFGRLTLDAGPVARLGPEPLEAGFTSEYLFRALRRSARAIKVLLLDQSLVAGIGNIYASEALFRARISPRRAARRLTRAQVRRLCRAIRETLADAIDCGSTVPLDYAGTGGRDGLFYFGRAPGSVDNYAERLRVYDREGRPCVNCGGPIRRLVQTGRSTFYCPLCQR